MENNFLKGLIALLFYADGIRNEKISGCRFKNIQKGKKIEFFKIISFLLAKQCKPLKFSRMFSGRMPFCCVTYGFSLWF